ncbi:1862_t:CDS:10 [Ambispora leptoticha]|uniref:1862_t:CDS:1 n=1 Tax=Ambispora leptoticha TaxID=144679 RepID=A0A9N9BCR6_9GLOM|nr:1862_t:CDS:10 [Ambispora leptoticha]
MATANNLIVGARCEIHGDRGTIRFVGHTDFQPGKWVGVELDNMKGKNDGSVNGKKYFECKPNYGVFVRASQIKTILPSAEGNENGGPSMTPQSDTSNPSSNSATPEPRFAPANDPTVLKARERLKSPTLLTSSMLPSLKNASATAALRSGSLKTPGSEHIEDDATMTDEVYFDEPLDTNGEADLSMASAAGGSEYNMRETPVRQLDSPDPFSLSMSRDQTVPLKDFEELRLKVKILDRKLQEEREKVREAELMKQEAAQFTSIKPKLQAKMVEMQSELRELRKQLKEARAEKELYENKYTEAAESMEMMTLDKEMAEEKAENLQHEVNLLKEKIEEISVDLSVFKQEGDLINSTEINVDGRTAVEIIQLERQNERLKDALVRLRDVTSENESEQNKKIKQYEKELASLQEIQVQYDQLRNHLKTAESQIEDLKARLDDALSAEDMLEQLTEKNLAMGERIEEMRITIDDLEALKELNDELEESHIENEKQLQSELDQKDILIREYTKRIEAAEETNADYENTINQFRELVANLQSDLDQIRQKEESQSESNNLSSQSQAMLNLNFQLQSTVMKQQAKQIDLELRKMEAVQASDKLSYVQSYLPESFFKTENDSINCLLLLKRLVFKSELVIKQLDQIHNIPEKLNAVVPEELIAVCELRQKLAWFSDLGKRLIVFINGCPVETFLKMGQVYHDLVGTERRLDSIVEMLRKEELKEANYIEVVQGFINQLDHLKDKYLTNTQSDNSEKFYAFVRAVDFNADTIAVTLGHIKQAVALACKDDEVNVSGIEQFTTEFFRPLQNLVTKSKSSKVMARKLLRRLDDLAQPKKPLTLKPELLAQFQTCYTTSANLVSFCLEAWKEISSYLSQKKELMFSGLQQLIYKVTERILSINEMNMWEGCTHSLQGLCQEVDNLNNLSNDSERSVEVVRSESPWVIRAKNIKAEVLVNLEMERKVQQSAEEIRELIKEVKLKDQALQEAQVKIDLQEKRLESMKNQSDQIASLEQKLLNSQKQQTQYEEAMNSLHTEFEKLEKENHQFKVLQVTLEDHVTTPTTSKRNTMTSFPDEEDFSSQIIETNSVEIQRLNSQIESLKFAVRFLRAENSQLRGRVAIDILNLHLPPKKRSINDNEVVKSVAQEAKSLLKEFRAARATLKIVDLNKATTNHRGWQPKGKLPNSQYLKQQSALEMYKLQQRSNELKAKLAQIGKTDKLKLVKHGGSGTQPPFIGRIQVPLPESTTTHHHSENKSSLTKTPLRHIIKLKNAADFEKIHTIFVN